MCQMVHYVPIPSQRVCCARVVHLLPFSSHQTIDICFSHFEPWRSEHVQPTDVWSLHRAVLVHQPSPSMDWSVVSLVWQRNSLESRRPGSEENTQKDPGPSCSIVSSPPVINGLLACARLLTAGSMSSDTITSLVLCVHAPHQIMPDIVLCVADSLGSMPRSFWLDHISPPKFV